MSFEVFHTIFSFLLLVAFFAFFYFRQKALLQFFQQEEYEIGRFLAWVWDKKAFDKRASLLIIGALFLDDKGVYITTALYLLSFVWGIKLSHASLSGSKKPLVMTMRAKRILWLSMVVAGASFFLADYLTAPKSTVLLFMQLPPLFLVLADLLLKPFEINVKNKFLQEAKDKIRNLDPIVIGITGSYGKTSTKHILSHILSASAPTLATPGSVNTEMGVTRIIREQLEKRHKYFIVEMGAYGQGSIEKLCALAPPTIGIITGIGQAHLERFGNVETIFKAKFELADATFKNQGGTIINATRMPQNLIEKRLNEGGEHFMVMRVNEISAQADRHLTDISADQNGLHFTLKGDDKTTISAPVFGNHQAENIALAIMVAQKLGVPIDTVQAALKNLPQTRHRLELFKSDNSPWVLDDAYNSNPTGFAEALHTLSMLVKSHENKTSKSYLITPGMVEMGSDHEKSHYEIGKLAGSLVDITAIVTAERIPSFIKGFEETKKPDAVLNTFKTQHEAQAWVKQQAITGDVILYENNLPDLFEAKISF